jgi:hypothetical protein
MLSRRICPSRCQFRLLAYVVCSLWVAFATDSLSYGQSKSDLIRMLRDREEVLSDYAVEFEVTRLRRRSASETNVPRTNGIPNNGNLPDMIRYQSVTSAIASKPKWTIDVTADFDNMPAMKRERSAFDGHVYSHMHGSMERWHSGAISKSVIILNGTGVEEFTVGHQVLYSKAVRDLGESVELDDQGLIRVSFLPREELAGDTKRSFRGLIWFDPRIGCAPVRQQLQARQSADWVDGPFWVIDEFHQDESGIYLPKTIRRETKVASNVDMSPSDRIEESVTYSLRNWTIGSVDAQLNFRVAFPADVIVQDQRSGKNFRAIELSDWEILKEVENVESFSPIRRYSAFIIVALVIVVIGWYVVRRRVS